MPLYEYYCRECNGVFEALRPVRETAATRPCPECDADAERLITRDFAAFTVREGLPRRIPDRGTYWHGNSQVSKPDTSMKYLQSDDEDPPSPATVEEIEQFQHVVESDAAINAEMAESGEVVSTDSLREQQKIDFVERVRKAGTTKRRSTIHTRGEPKP